MSANVQPSIRHRKAMAGQAPKSAPEILLARAPVELFLWLSRSHGRRFMLRQLSLRQELERATLGVMSLGELEAILAALNSSVDDVLIPALGRVNGDLKARLGQIEHEMAALRQTIASQNDRLESISDSLRKIERRLQLITPP